MLLGKIARERKKIDVWTALEILPSGVRSGKETKKEEKLVYACAPLCKRDAFLHRTSIYIIFRRAKCLFRNIPRTSAEIFFSA